MYLESTLFSGLICCRLSAQHFLVNTFAYATPVSSNGFHRRFYHIHTLSTTGYNSIHRISIGIRLRSRTTRLIIAVIRISVLRRRLRSRWRSSPISPQTPASLMHRSRPRVFVSVRVLPPPHGQIHVHHNRLVELFWTVPETTCHDGGVDEARLFAPLSAISS